jgi:hypothetical protein
MQYYLQPSAGVYNSKRHDNANLCAQLVVPLPFLKVLHLASSVQEISHSPAVGSRQLYI